MSEMLLLSFEIVGTIAFAVSGALLGLEKQMDILGISILGLTTAVGGGVIRDLILGLTPPMTFRNPLYAIIAIGVSILVFIIARKRSVFQGKWYETVMLIMDSIGLGVFTVVGINTAYSQDGEYNIFLLVFVGVVTGVGGGSHQRYDGRRPAIHICQTLLCQCFYHRSPCLRSRMALYRQHNFHVCRYSGSHSPPSVRSPFPLEPSEMTMHSAA